MTNPQVFVIGGGDGSGSRVFTSPDGITWTSRPANFNTSTVVASTWSPELEKFLAGAQQANYITRSIDGGATWQGKTSGFGTGQTTAGLAWSPARHLFVAVGGSGGTAKISTSVDGESWTARAVPAYITNMLNAVCWSAPLGLFVIGGLNGALATSPDGINWTDRSSTTFSFKTAEIRGFAWSPELALFVGVGQSGTLCTSPTGVSWLPRVSSFGGSTIFGVTWSPELTLFVAVGQDGKIATSPDGITWTQQTPRASTLLTVAWSAELTLFVAGGNDGVITSPDGITWTARALPTGAALIGTANWSAVPENKAPNAPILTGPLGAVLDRAVVNRFSWTFSDPNPGDSQSKFDLRYRVEGTATWTDVTDPVPVGFWDAPGGTFAAEDYEWQVRTYDALGVVGPYAPSEFFTASDTPPAPTFTDPINGQTIAATYTATISAPEVDASQWRAVADNAGTADPTTVYQDSGVLEDPTRRTYGFTFSVNDRTEHLQARVRDGGLWSLWATVRVVVSYTPPPTPSFTLTPAGTVLVVQVLNPAPGVGEPNVIQNDIYVTEGDAEERRAIVGANGTWIYPTPKSGVDYDPLIRVETVGDNDTRASS